MAITCPRCGKDFDVTLFQFGHVVQCDCGTWVERDRGHEHVVRDAKRESPEAAEEDRQGDP